MKLKANIKQSVAAMSALLLTLFFGFVNCGYAWDYGNGRHGIYVLTTNATIDQLYQTVRLPSDPAQYNPADSNAIPNFQILIITNGATLTANAWNGSTGGTISLKVQGALVIANGSAISVSGLGYRGGGTAYPGQYAAGVQGESYAGSPAASGSANYGGGGGSFVWSVSNGNPNYTGPGAGGGYGGNGAATGNSFCSCGPTGGGTYGTPSIDTVYLGSGGGGSAPSGYPNGGNGGGAIAVTCGNLNLQGQIHADGNAGGGGGSGGSIKLLVATANFGTNQITAVGGNGFAGNGTAAGGFGRIAIYYAESYSGIASPAAYALFDTNSDNVTVITNQPAPQISFLGSNVVFSVGENGFPPLFFQWNFNNVPIPNATNQTLSLFNLDFTNQGNYSVAISNVVGTVISSNAYLTVLDPRDPWGDGIPNWWKTQFGLSLTDSTLATNYPPADSQLTYLEIYLYGLNPLTNDTDGDGISDYNEIFVYHTNPTNVYTTGDGIPDGWKIEYGLNPLIADANNEAGFDGVTYMQVYQYDLTHTNQLNPSTAFSVGQGLSNYEIINGGQHTNKFYYDHEDRLQGMESSRGISIGYQYDGNGNLLEQNVMSRVSETNGLPVLWLWLNGLTNQPGIANQDSSGNGWNNYQEWLAGLTPNSNSVPSLLNNPGTNIASFKFPFTPSNCVMAAGELNGVVGDEIVVGADGNATGKTNLLFILTQGASSWQVQQLSVGAFGVTSIAVGQPTNRPSPAIYVGLRQIGGAGAIWELIQTNGLWQTNVLAVSTNQTAYVLGVRSADVLCSFATNGLDSALYSLAYSNGVWSQIILSTNSSHRGSGTHGAVFAQHYVDSALRLLDAGGIEISGGNAQLYTDNILLPQGTIQDTNTGKWHFTTPTAMTYSAASNYFAGFHGKLSFPLSGAENTFLSAHFPALSWVGLYWAASPNISFGGGPYYVPFYGDGSAAPYIGTGTSSAQYNGSYQNWFNPNQNFWVGPCTVFNYGLSGEWGCASGNDSYPGIGEPSDVVLIYTNQWLIPEPTATSRFPSSGISLSTGLPRPTQTNSSSVFYAFADDLNQSGRLDAGDDFTLAEYIVSGNIWTTNTLFQVPITAANAAQSFSLAAVNFTGTGKDTLFTGEPDGRIYSWSGTDASSPLQRQLFSDAYVGKAWQAMCGVQMPALGKGLAGLMVDPTNQSVCNVIFWPSQGVLPTPQPSLIETAPSAAVIPSANTLGSNAVVIIRLWDNEGNASTPFLQYQFLGASTWQNATLTVLDGTPYNLAMRVTALPSGNNHTLEWNALADVGANVVTNILLRVSAQDFMLIGNWSQPAPFQLNTTITTNPTNSPANFTGITPIHGGVQFNWQGSTNAWLYLQRSPTLAGTNAVWVNIWTGVPPTLNFGSYTDFFGTNSMGFYRLKIVNP